jgi:hypothetical protein
MASNTTTKAANARLDPQVVIQIAQQLGLVDLLKEVFRGLLGRVFGGRHDDKLPDPPATPAAPPAPGQPAPVPIVPKAPKVASMRLEIQKAEAPDLSTPERRVNPGALYSDPMGMARSGSAFNYGTSFWLNVTLFDENGDPIEDHELVDGNLEYRIKHSLFRGAELVAYIKGEGDIDPVGEGEPAPYHAWSIADGSSTPGRAAITIADKSWRQSAGLNARIRIDAQGEWRAVADGFDGIQSNEVVFKTS